MVVIFVDHYSVFHAGSDVYEKPDCKVYYLSAFACSIFQSVYHADKYVLHRNLLCSIICCHQ